MGHRINPFEITATRAYARKEPAKSAKLVLSSLAPAGKEEVDLLDLVIENVVEVEPLASEGGLKQFQVVKVKRIGNKLLMVVACDSSGEWETVRERPDDDGGVSPVVFRKTDAHMSRIYSFVLLHRPPGESRGLILVHRPWNRGPTGPQIGKLIQRAVRMNSEAKATIATRPLMDKTLALQMLKNQDATKIAYRKRRRVVDPNDPDKLVEVEWDILIKGKATAGVRKKFQQDVIKKIEQEMPTDDLMTLTIPGEDGQDSEEHFEDVRLSLGSGSQGTTGTYSILEQEAPKMALVRDSEMQAIYAGLGGKTIDASFGEDDDDGAAGTDGEDEDDDDEIQETLLERCEDPMVSAAAALGFQ